MVGAWIKTALVIGQKDRDPLFAFRNKKVPSGITIHVHRQDAGIQPAHVKRQPGLKLLDERTEPFSAVLNSGLTKDCTLPNRPDHRSILGRPRRVRNQISVPGHQPLQNADLTASPADGHPVRRVPFSGKHPERLVA